jgi:predicted nucleotide-binding protein
MEADWDHRQGLMLLGKHSPPNRTEGPLQEFEGPEEKAELAPRLARRAEGPLQVFERPDGKAELARQLTRQLIVRNEEIARRMAEVGTAWEYDPGQTIYEKGEPGDNLCCLLSGAVDVLIEGQVAGAILENEAFGEFPVVKLGSRYTVTTRAREHSTVALIPATQFRAIAREYPEVWINMIETLINRLRNTYARVPKQRPPCVFICHGRSSLWKEVEAFLQKGLRLKTVEFDSKSGGGETFVEILNKRLGEATFAVVVLTAEDQTAQGSKRARQNVIHEAGLCQGRLGFQNTMLLVQTGIEQFSNIDGLKCLRFDGDAIAATFPQLEGALRREKQLGASARARGGA